MTNERYRAITEELFEITKLRRDGVWDANVQLLLLVVSHLVIFYLVSLIGHQFLLIFIASYTCSLIIVWGCRLYDAFKRHEIHNVTINDEILRLQELVYENLIPENRKINAADIVPNINN